MGIIKPNKLFEEINKVNKNIDPSVSKKINQIGSSNQSIPSLDDLNITDQFRSSFIYSLIAGISALAPKEKQAIDDPIVKKKILDAINIATYQKSVDKKELLRNLVINRIKSYNVEFNEIIYDEAILVIPKLTAEQIRFISIIDIISVLIFPLINVENDFYLNKLSEMEKYLEHYRLPSNLEIEHLKCIGLISSSFPYEIDTEKILSYSDTEYKTLVEKCKKIISSEAYLKCKLNQIQLTAIGLAIGHTNLTEITKTNINQKEFDVPIRLADFQARNIYAIETVTSYSIGKT